MRLLAVLGLLAALLACSLSVPVHGQYTPSWDSLDKRPIPDWYLDAKFGVFIHWGVYSVPSWGPPYDYAEWYWHSLVTGADGGATENFHAKTYGANFKYQDFAPMFKAELFNATEWAELLRRSGARYVVPTSKHHEGFTLWPSAQSWNWNAVDVGPHRDLLGELLTAVRASGLHAGLYYSLYEWFHPFYLSNVSMYVDQVMLPQFRDLANNYQPDIIWTDGEWEQNSTTWRSEEFLAWLFNDSPVKSTVVVNDRWGINTRGKHGGIYTSEYSPQVFLDHPWEENQGVDNYSYGFNRATAAENYFTAEQLILLLVRTVANNGNLLVDIGPAADGTIPTIMQERLLQMGAWLDVNGEAIYGTRKWRVQQEDGIDNTTVRYTASKDSAVIFALLIEWPANNNVSLPSPVPKVDASVSMLGVRAPASLQWKPNPSGGIVVQLPSFNPGSPAPCDYVWALRLVNFA